MQISDFIAHVRSHVQYKGQIVHIEEIPARAAQHGALAKPLSESLQEILEERGLLPLYSHQAQALNAVREGEDIIVATGTASGKTLCYNVPTLEGILEDELSRALYLFPTKALAQDQLRALGELTQGERLDRIRFDTYDGDTPRSARGRIRRRAAIILSNPDMLHLGILPNHTSWGAFFRHLKYVVLDEAHIYRGIFGSHVACVMRRLQRVCARYGADPQFILSSATIANPREHAERLIGREVKVVEQNGAPRGSRQFLLWNAPYRDERGELRHSVNSEATWLFAAMVEKGVRNITFVRTRKVAELILLYAQEALEPRDPALAERISAYRGGYLAEERREIEQRLFSGELLGVVATNALELGIDVGELQATMLVGYPGTIASTWQQAGRAGRGEGEALSILIGRDDPLDQFFMHHPRELFRRSHERALIDPQNPHLLASHLTCAAYEAPLAPEEEALFGEGYMQAAETLEDEGVLQRRGRRWYYPSDDYPAQGVNLRATSGQRYALVDDTDNSRLIEEVDAAMAFIRIYPGCVYLHRGESYLITSLDLQAQVAHARPADVPYYTQPMEMNEVHIVRSLQARQLERTNLFFGRVRVTQQVIGFRRRQQFDHSLLSEEPLNLPPHFFETQSLWFAVPEEIAHTLADKGLDFAGGLHALEHALVGLLPLYAMCDRNDIGGLSTPRHPDTDRPEIFIYDGYPGGVGITKAGFELVEGLWQRTWETIRDCPCEEGCPSCIQSPKCG
ncbi:MAG: DEAD/DEAH box helicase, partial [Anaerolineales bacterium]